MRGADQQQGSMLCLLSPDQRVPKSHPLRSILRLANEVLRGMDSELDEMYSGKVRPSIPPERLLKSFILMAMYSIRSERLFCEQLDYKLLFRWFWTWTCWRTVSTTRFSPRTCSASWITA